MPAKPTFLSLQDELANDDYKVRKEAIRKLMRYYRPQALEPLLILLHDKRGDVRNKAVQALGRLADPRAFQSLQALLVDKNANVRARVIRALGNFGDRSIVPVLLNLLNDQQSRIRQAAARSLGKLKDRRATVPLLAYLANAEPEEYYNVILALCDLDNPGVVEPLLAWVDRHTDLDAPSIVAEGLSRMGEAVIDSLLSILADTTRTSKVRMCAVQALGNRPRPEFAQPLIAALNDSGARVRQYAAQALGVLKDPVAIDPLLRLLDDEDEWVCCSAIHALVELNATCAVEPLTKLLSHEQRCVAERAALALGRLRDSRALVPLLDALFQETGPGWRAAQALCEIGDPAIVEPLLRRLPASSNLQCWYSLMIFHHFPDPRALEPLRHELHSRALDLENWYERQLQAGLRRLLDQLGDASVARQGSCISPFFIHAALAQPAPGQK
ncbi:MAG TPA: HEAT repeat domain-containing protein [Ktedonobacteraceae bacterium]|nr:HEAT repeat domain-containing protein [Ktedonobacteraceae bacterium]